AAVLAAVVERAVRIDDHVPDLARRAVTAAMEAAVDDQTAAYTGRPSDVDHVASPAPGPAVELAQPGHVGVVREVHLGARGAAEHLCEGHILPGQVGRVDQDAAQDVDRTGSSDRDAGHLLTAAKALDL